jgi:hypothetical protein
MATFVYCSTRKIMVNKETREPMVDPSKPFVPVTPMHIPDIQPYLSPVSGEYVSGRRAKAEDLAKHNCIDASDLPSPTGGKIKSRKLARKYNLPDSVLHEEAKA